MQADAAVNPAPDGSSVRSTVMVEAAAMEIIEGAALRECNTTTLRSPFSF